MQICIVVWLCSQLIIVVVILCENNQGVLLKCFWCSLSIFCRFLFIEEQCSVHIHGNLVPVNGIVNASDFVEFRGDLRCPRRDYSCTISGSFPFSVLWHATRRADIHIQLQSAKTIMETFAFANRSCNFNSHLPGRPCWCRLLDLLCDAISYLLDSSNVIMGVLAHFI